MRITTAGSEQVRITSGGDLLVNTTTDTSGGFSIQTISNNTTSTRILAHGFSVRNNWGTATNLGNGIFSPAGSTLAFSTASTERMRIDSSGRAILGTTGPLASSNAVLHINADGVSSGAGSFITQTTLTSQVFHVHFRNGNGGVGGISTNGTSTAYATSSDHRLKENVTADWDATTRLKQLNPVRFNFIADADKTVDGFLAHEVQSVVPEAISGTHNEVDDDGNPVYQGIDQSKLVPLLVKTIQELEARITALETA